MDVVSVEGKSEMIDAVDMIQLVLGNDTDRSGRRPSKMKLKLLLIIITDLKEGISENETRTIKRWSRTNDIEKNKTYTRA